MKPIKFDGANVVFGAEQPEYQPIAGRTRGKGPNGPNQYVLGVGPGRNQKGTGNRTNLRIFVDVRATVATRVGFC